MGAGTSNRIVIGLLAAAAFAMPLAAQDSPVKPKDRETFDTLYGEKLTSVNRTRATADDKTLAKEMLGFAAGLPDTDTGVRCLVYGNVVTLSSNASDLSLMREALDKLEAAWPGQDVVPPEQLMQLASRGYRGVDRRERDVQGEHYIDLLLIVAQRYEDANDPEQAIGVCRLASTVARTITSDQLEPIQDRIDRLASDSDMAKRIQMLERSVQKNPQNSPAARELVKLLITKRHDPQAAAKYVASTSDEELIDLVQRCAAGIEQANAATAMRIADWYVALAEDEQDERALPLLNKARQWYERFFSQYRRDDALVRHVREMDNLANLRIERLIDDNPELGAGPADGWASLIAPPFDTKKHTLGEPEVFSVDDGEITIDGGALVIPFEQGKAYEVRLTLNVHPGARDSQAAISLYLPVSDDRFILTRYHATGDTLARVDKVSEKRLINDVPDRTGKKVELVFQVAELNGQVAFAMLYQGKAALKWQGELEELEELDEEQRERLPEDIGPAMLIRCFQKLTVQGVDYKERG